MENDDDMHSMINAYSEVKPFCGHLFGWACLRVREPATGWRWPAKA